MQEEVNQKVISLSIQGVKITASVLKAALRKFLEMDNRRKQKATQVKMAEKTGRAQEKGREKARKKIEKKKPHGKQTIKQLNAQGVQLSNIKITDENIKSFDRVARKYGIDYSLKKEVGADPPKYLVFFMAFFSSAINILQTLVVAIGAGLGVWGVINLMEGYGNDNPGAKSQGIKQLMSGGGVILIGTQLIPLLSGLFG